MDLNQLKISYNLKHLIVILVVVFGALSCKKNEPKIPEVPSATGFKMENLLKNWSTSIIIPSYEEYYLGVIELQKASNEFKAAPSELALTNLKTKWKKAYLSWQLVAMYEFGPAADITLRSETNIYPVDTSKLNKLVSEGSININGANKLDVKGFPALDYLINSGMEVDLITRYTNGTEGKSRLNYLDEVVAQLVNNALQVKSKWDVNDGDYATQFITATGTDAGSSIALVVNTLTQHIERHLRDGKLGIPNGNRNFTGTTLPNHIEALYDGSSSIDLALENLVAIESFYLGITADGANGIGLDDYLISLGAEYNEGSLNDAVKSQFTLCIEKIKAIPRPLKENLISNKARVDEAVKELQRLIILFKADIPSATGVLISYQDNDGD